MRGLSREMSYIEGISELGISAAASLQTQTLPMLGGYEYQGGPSPFSASDAFSGVGEENDPLNDISGLLGGMDNMLDGVGSMLNGVGSLLGGIGEYGQTSGCEPRQSPCEMPQMPREQPRREECHPHSHHRPHQSDRCEQNYDPCQRNYDPCQQNYDPCQERGPMSSEWTNGTQVQVAGDPHDYVNGTLVDNWADTNATEKVFLDGNSEIDVNAGAPNTPATSVRTGQDLSGISSNAQVEEMINGQLTNVGTAGQLGLTSGWSSGQTLSAGQTVNLNGLSVSWDGNGTVTMNQG